MAPSQLQANYQLTIMQNPLQHYITLQLLAQLLHMSAICIHPPKTLFYRLMQVSPTPQPMLQLVKAVKVEKSCVTHSFANQHAVKPSNDMQLSAGKHTLKHTSRCLASKHSYNGVNGPVSVAGRSIQDAAGNTSQVKQDASHTDMRAGTYLLRLIATTSVGWQWMWSCNSSQKRQSLRGLTCHT